MKYSNVVEARFVNRPNRFIAHVELDGQIETVHVKNTGRCKELLLPGAKVILERSDNLTRKTRYDLIAVYKEPIGLINMDSQAPNKVVKEWLEGQDFDYVKPEYTYGKSRIDFYMEKGTDKYLLEVKGCTLENNGHCNFPDAPTERGVKHLHELIKAKKDGYRTAVLILVQMEKVTDFSPNDETHKAFGDILRLAASKGVEILCYNCKVTPDSLELKDKVKVVL